MSRLLIFLGMTIGGYLGWWAGSLIGPVTAFVFSGIASMLGIYVGWLINRDYFG